LAQQGLENPYDKFHERLTPFMRAHSKLTESDDISFYCQSTLKVAQRALRESSKDSIDERENDAFTKALQTKQQQDNVSHLVFYPEPSL
jgi:23S rRNA A2030 N6-methylase RlmJ